MYRMAYGTVKRYNILGNIMCGQETFEGKPTDTVVSSNSVEEGRTFRGMPFMYAPATKNTRSFTIKIHNQTIKKYRRDLGKIVMWHYPLEQQLVFIYVL